MAYQPSFHNVSNKPAGLAQSSPTDARSQFYDESTFSYRDYASTAEVLAYLDKPKYREGGFPVFINVGGTLQNGKWLGGERVTRWFKQGTGNADVEDFLPTISLPDFDESEEVGPGGVIKVFKLKEGVGGLKLETVEIRADIQSQNPTPRFIFIQSDEEHSNASTFNFFNGSSIMSFQPIAGTVPMTTPAAPTGFVGDDNANTAGFTPSTGYTATQHEYSIDNGATWQNVTANPIPVGNVTIASGNLQIRVKAGTYNNPSAVLASDIAYSAVIIPEPITWTEPTGTATITNGGVQVNGGASAGFNSSALATVWMPNVDGSYIEFTKPAGNTDEGLRFELSELASPGINDARSRFYMTGSSVQSNGQDISMAAGDKVRFIRAVDIVRVVASNDNFVNNNTIMSEIFLGTNSMYLHVYFNVENKVMSQAMGYKLETIPASIT